MRLTARPVDAVTAVAEVQDSRAPGFAGAGAALRDPVDLHQGYLDLGTGDSPLQVRIGRQEMAYGGERVLSRNDWRNTGRSFDAVRAFVRRGRLGVDLFGAAEVRRDPAGPNPFRAQGDLYGAFGRFEARSGVRLEPYLLWRRLPGAENRGAAIGAERRRTVGLRAVRTSRAGLNLAAEGAWQGGSRGRSRIGAWFASAIATWMVDSPRRPSLSIEFTEASGDRSATDSRSGAFDPMYPTGHAHYGFTDLFQGRNLRDVRVGVAWQPWAGSSLRVDLHDFRLSTPADGLYAPSSRLVVPSAGGGSATHVGVEIDVALSVPLRESVLLGAGYSHLRPGAVLRTRTLGGGGRYPYAFLVLDF